MNYYNEFDLETATWLQELINRGLIPNGDVDTRSITEISPNELTQYTQCHFFAGIGGWSLALQLAGWPADRPVWTGSCPCQPFSTAGKGLAQADERHLWPVFFNLIKECKPKHVFGEQVASAIGKGWLDGISADLEAEGYACGATVLGAHSVGAPHIRQRLYWVADSDGGRLKQCDEGIGSVSVVDQNSADGGLADSDDTGSQGRLSEELREYPNQRSIGTCGSPCRLGDTSSQRHDGQHSLLRQEEPRRNTGDILQVTGACKAGWSSHSIVQCRDGKARRIPTEPAFFPLAPRVPARMVRLRGYGNAIVPQVAAEFITAFTEETKIFTKSLDV